MDIQIITAVCVGLQGGLTSKVIDKCLGECYKNPGDGNKVILDALKCMLDHAKGECKEAIDGVLQDLVQPPKPPKK